MLPVFFTQIDLELLPDFSANNPFVLLIEKEVEMSVPEVGERRIDYIEWYAWTNTTKRRGGGGG